MELAYLSDPMTRFSAMNLYPTWEEINYNDKYSKPKKSFVCKEMKTNEKNCSICQQKKKRILSDYIKSKQMDCRNSTSIQEEDEEAEEGDNNTTEKKKQELKVVSLLQNDDMGSTTNYQRIDLIYSTAQCSFSADHVLIMGALYKINRFVIY